MTTRQCTFWRGSSSNVKFGFSHVNRKKTRVSRHRGKQLLCDMSARGHFHRVLWPWKRGRRMLKWAVREMHFRKIVFFNPWNQSVEYISRIFSIFEQFFLLSSTQLLFFSFFFPTPLTLFIVLCFSLSLKCFHLCFTHSISLVSLTSDSFVFITAP